MMEELKELLRAFKKSKNTLKRVPQVPILGPGKVRIYAVSFLKNFRWPIRRRNALEQAEFAG